MSVTNGQSADQTTFNNAFVSRTTDDNTLGKKDLQNTDPASGADVINAQREINSLNAFTGRPSGSAHDANPSWTNNDVGSSTDSVKQRADLVTAKFNGTTGHKHTGAVGDSAPIDYLGVVAPLQGFNQEAVGLTGVTGGSHDVSTELAAKEVSTSSTVEGVPSTAPYNKVFVRYTTSDDPVEDGSGNQVYGRLTNSGGVGGTWTLTFYSDVAGVETAYSFSGSNNIRFWYQELFHPLDPARPVYSQDFFVPSDNATADVVDATALQAGKVSTGTQAFGGTKSFQDSVAVGQTAVPDASAVLEAESTTKGFLPPRMTELQRDAIVSPATGLLVFNTDTNLFNFYDGVAWAEVGSGGGGGGGAPTFLPLSGNAMTPFTEYNSEVWLAEAGLSQELFAEVWVPDTYSAGSQIKMYVPWYSPDVSGTGLIQTVATLVRTGVDAASSVVNQRTSTNAAVNLATAPLADKMQSAVCDLSSAIGEINAVAISPGDLILVKLLRGTDTATSDIRVKAKGVGVTFNG